MRHAHRFALLIVACLFALDIAFAQPPDTIIHRLNKHVPLGGAVLIPRDTTLLVSELGSSGLDGVSVLLPGVDGFCLAFATPICPGSNVTGSAISLAVGGGVFTEPSGWAADLTFVDEGSDVSITTDFSPNPAPCIHVRVCNAGVGLAWVCLPDGQVATLPDDACIKEVDWLTFNSDSHGFSVLLQDPVSITVDGVSYVGDQIKIFPDFVVDIDDGFGLAPLSDFRFTTNAVSSFSIGNEVVQRFRPSIQVPREISFQGVLTDVARKPLPDGTHRLRFGIYSLPDGGSAVWSDTQSVALSGGVFDASLGRDQAFPILVGDQSPYYLGISVDGESELRPRTALTSVPYALRAAVADSLSANVAVTGLNGATGEVVLRSGIGVAIEQSGDTLTIRSTGTSGSDTGRVRAITSVSGQILIRGMDGQAVDVALAPGSVTAREVLDSSLGAADLQPGLLGLRGSARIDFDSVGRGATRDRVIEVRGATPGAPVSLGISNSALTQAGLPADVSYTAWISSPGVVTIRCRNHSSATVNPDTADFNVVVTQW